MAVANTIGEDTKLTGAALADFDKVLSLGIVDKAKELAAGSSAEIPSEVMELLEQRREARAAKDFALADELRDKIAMLGYAVRETRQGTEITKI